MSPINLSQTNQPSTGTAKKATATDKGVLIALAIFIFTLLVFGSLFLYTKTLDGKVASISKEIDAETLSLAAKNVDGVADFQKRLENIDSNISSKRDPNDALKRLGASMVPGAVIISFKLNSGNGSIDFQADNFQTAAKQIVGFKKEGNFNNVAVTKIDREQSGKIIISLSISL
jgi:hypothetical protein